MTDDIATHCEEATGPDRSIDGMIAESIGATMPNDPAGWPPRYTASVDAAMTLLPPRACNIDLFSFGGGGREDLPRGATCWGFKFHDQDQLVGIERAKAEVQRLRKDSGGLFKVSGAPKMVMERAIAENFMEFSSSHAANAALAICAAALRAAHQHS